MKFKLNYFINMGMAVAFLLCGASGAIKMPELGVGLGDEAYNVLSIVHDYTGLVALVLALTHVLLHLSWFRNATKAILAPREARLKAASPRKALAFSRAAKSLAALLLVLSLSGGYAWARGGHACIATIPQGIAYPAGSLKDGVYAGTATGYEPGLSVKVTVKSGKIASIDIVEHNETMRWFLRVINVIPNRVLAAQGTRVDIVSGATSSSYGIMSAVENALKKAAK